MTKAVVGGIFVGGKSLRMGGTPKGLLTTPEGETVVAKLRRTLEEIGVPCVLVGNEPAYADQGLPVLVDRHSDLGPLGGLLALLEFAGDRFALSVACDMPFLTRDLLVRLRDAPAAPIVATRRGEARQKWDPFFARYDATAILPLAEQSARAAELSLQSLFERADAVALPLSSEEARALEDWDSPADRARMLVR